MRLSEKGLIAATIGLLLAIGNWQERYESEICSFCQQPVASFQKLRTTLF